MHVTVISPESAVFDGEAEAITAPAFDGQVGILPRHAPFMTVLGEGRLVVRQAGGTRAFRAKGGGFLQVVDDLYLVEDLRTLGPVALDSDDYAA
jgi:F-type H+-transporting ATPase subunit epsilon